MNCCTQNNGTLWILIALLVLTSKDGCCFGGNFLSGCSLPIIIALLYCLYKNGTLSSILTPPCNPCCNCCC
ncbi:MAG: hypothetical protein E7343_03030 [Clostridiales bacterium]|nr:hypothetical protein [Clostridiales bacterium]